MIAGRVREPFEWRGRHFAPGDWVMLDLYGTNHHPGLWQHPERFDPDRFLGRDGNAFDFVAQGGGDVAAGHRCPGENPAIALLMTAIGGLACGLRYEVPPQDLRYRLDRFPALPSSGFVMSNVRRVGDGAYE
jgi:fatty-acid peroxygenase